jgi:hypothetical protein
MGKTVVGLMDSFDEARELIADLRDNDFPGEVIGLIAREPEDAARLAAREELSDNQMAGVTGRRPHCRRPGRPRTGRSHRGRLRRHSQSRRAGRRGAVLCRRGAARRDTGSGRNR